MAPSGRLKRPLSLKVDVGGDNLKFLDVAKAFFDQFGPASIRCCQPKGRGVFHVTCSSYEDYATIFGSGAIKIGQASFQVTPVDSDEIMITVIGAPFELDAAVVSNGLRPYGDVISWDYETDKEFPQLTNGNRQIKIKVRSPIPNVIMAGSYRVNVQYRGVRRQCYKCGETDHLARECVREDRRWVQKAADRALEEFEKSLKSTSDSEDTLTGASSKGATLGDADHPVQENETQVKENKDLPSKVKVHSVSEPANNSEEVPNETLSLKEGANMQSKEVKDNSSPMASTFSPMSPTSPSLNETLPQSPPTQSPDETVSPGQSFNATVKNSTVPVHTEKKVPISAVTVWKAQQTKNSSPITPNFAPGRVRTAPKRPSTSSSGGNPRKK